MCLYKLLIFLVIVSLINCVLIEANELIDEYNDNDSNDDNVVDDDVDDDVKIITTNHLSRLVNGTTTVNKVLENRRQQKSIFMVRKKNRKCGGYKHDANLIKC
uniref:Uncharacterized protein n=1 Tax=Glossina brevipalpis TaxID=37001 RepID=A0A1A9WPQ0_9MUSC